MKHVILSIQALCCLANALREKLISRRPVQITQGINRMPCEANNLDPGLDVFTLTEGLNTISWKMVVDH